MPKRGSWKTLLTPFISSRTAMAVVRIFDAQRALNMRGFCQNRLRMLRPQQVRQFCERRYPSFLRSLVTGERFFPLDVPFGRLKATHDHRLLSQEIKALADGT